MRLKLTEHILPLPNHGVAKQIFDRNTKQSKITKAKEVQHRLS